MQEIVWLRPDPLGAHIAPQTYWLNLHVRTEGARFTARTRRTGSEKAGTKKEGRDVRREWERRYGGTDCFALRDRGPWLLIRNCFDYSEIQQESSLVWMIWWMWTGKTAVYDDQGEESRRWSDTGHVDRWNCQQCVFLSVCDLRGRCCLYCHIVHSRGDCY